MITQKQRYQSFIYFGFEKNSIFMIYYLYIISVIYIRTYKFGHIYLMVQNLNLLAQLIVAFQKNHG